MNGEPHPRCGDSKDAGWPRVAVVVITKDRPELARCAVKSILGTDYPPEKRRIIVLEETDHPLPIEGQNVDYHSIPRRGLGFGFARNQALQFVKEEIVAFTDDDCIAERSWLREIVRPLLVNRKAGAVGGAVLVPDCGPVGQCENILGFPGGGVKYVHESGGGVVRRPTCSTCNCAMRTGAIEDAGGFDETLRSGGEDERLSRMIGRSCEVLYTPEARVYHRPRDSIRGVFAWFVRRGVSAQKAVQSSGNRSAEVRRMLRSSPLVRLVLLLTFCIGLRRAGPIVFACVLILYYGAMLRRYRWSRRYHGSGTTFLLVPVVKAIMDMGMDIGVLCGLLRRDKSCVPGSK